MQYIIYLPYQYPGVIGYGIIYNKKDMPISTRVYFEAINY